MSEENKVIICSSCAAENVEGNKFCTNCGQKLPEPMVPAYEAVEAEILEETAENVYGEPMYEELVNESAASGEELEINYGEPVEETAPQVQPAAPVYYSSGAAETPASSGQSTGFAIASMICGILSILCCCTGWFGLILSIVAIVFGVLTIKNEYGGKGMAMAGIITGGIGVLMFVLILVVGFSSGELTSMIEDLM